MGWVVAAKQKGMIGYVCMIVSMHLIGWSVELRVFGWLRYMILLQLWHSHIFLEKSFSPEVLLKFPKVWEFQQWWTIPNISSFLMVKGLTTHSGLITNLQHLPQGYSCSRSPNYLSHKKVYWLVVDLQKGRYGLFSMHQFANSRRDFCSPHCFKMGSNVFLRTCRARLGTVEEVLNFPT